VVVIFLSSLNEVEPSWAAVGKIIAAIARHGLTKAVVTGTSFSTADAIMDSIQGDFGRGEINTEVVKQAIARIQLTRAHEMEKMKSESTQHTYVVVGFGSSIVFLCVISVTFLCKFYAQNKRAQSEV